MGITTERRLPFRTLVVVPRSHTDGTFEKLCGAAQRTGQVQCKNNSAAQRAVQLDVRPDHLSRHQSLFLAWDSRTVHQGHTHGTGLGGWSPPLHRPELFQVADERRWRSFLEEQGYVALVDPLPQRDVEEALRYLLKDLQLLCPGIKCLGDVREWHLPSTKSANDLRTGGGLCHGAFAWSLRTRPSISRLFERLFNLPENTPLVGSVDVVALAPWGSSATHGKGKQWLHLDYSPPQGHIWQCCVQLFPRTPELGSRWERIALMVCKAPAAWALPAAPRSLLACYVKGCASRATAAVTLGKIHVEGKERAAGRRLSPKLVNAEPALVQRLKLLSHGELLRQLSLEELRRIVPPQVAEYVWPALARTAGFGAKKRPRSQSAPAQRRTTQGLSSCDSLSLADLVAMRAAAP